MIFVIVIISGYLSLLFSILVCVYYWAMAIASFGQRGKQDQSMHDVLNSFAIVIPAHNEEKCISGVLEACKDIDYPIEKFEIIVIADNCNDSTSEIVRSNGITCYERHDIQNRGKGYALAYAFENLLPKAFDAFLIIDADCTIDANALTVLNTHLNQGEKSIQLNHEASNPDESSMSYAVSIGNSIEYKMFYPGKSFLGLPVFLLGTGMLLHRDLLVKFPWNAYSVVEDIDYSLNLIKNGISTRFLKNIRVKSKFAATGKQLTIQRTRWAEGNIGFSKTMALNLIFQGVKGRDGILIDAGWTLLILSRPLILCQLIVTLILGGIAVMLSRSPMSIMLLSGSILVALCQVVYFISGIMLLGMNMHRVKLLLKVPATIIRLTLISLKGLFSRGGSPWERTPR